MTIAFQQKYPNLPHIIHFTHLDNKFYGFLRATITSRVIKKFQEWQIIWNEWTHISTNVEHITNSDRYVHLVAINILKFKDL